jgi:hypothetical protein
MIKNLRIRELLSPAEIREIKEIYRFAHLCAARAEGTFRDFRDFCVTKNKVNDKYLELTTTRTTITTKTTQPLATVSPLNVVIVVICCREKESEDERKSVLSV